MATLDERLALAIAEKKAQTAAGSATAGPKGKPPAVTDFGRRVERAATTPNAPIHIDGIPVQQFKAGIQNQPNSRAAIERAITQKRLASPAEDRSGLLLTSPVARTGDRAIDDRGKPRPTAGGTGVLGMRGTEITRQVKGEPRAEEELFPTEFEFDSEEAVRLDRAEQGVDFRRGLPFLQRLQVATSSPIPRARSERITTTISDEIKKVPDGIVPLQYDPALQAFYLATQVTEEDVNKGFESEADVGKFRYVSLDGAGLELADFADLMNLGEIGSIGGAIVGAGKSKLLPFFKGRKILQSGAGAFAGGTAGRLTGDGLSVILDVMNSDGRFIPTREELADLGMDDVQTEALASILGEALSLGGRKSSEFVQDAYARMTGREGVFGSSLDVAQANVNIQQTKADLKRLKDVTGSEDIVVTKGQASGSIDIVEMENSRLKNASPATKRQIETERIKSDRATEQFVDNVFNGDLQVWNGRHGVINRANRAINDGNQLVTSTTDGVIGIHPMTSPEHGVGLRPVSNDTWRVGQINLPPNLQRMGIGTDLYKTAAMEARAHGAIIESSSAMEPGAYELWKSIDGTKELGKLNWHPEAYFDEAVGKNGKWLLPDHLADESIVSMARPDPYLPKLIESFMQPAQGRGGKMVANKEFARFLRRPGQGELGKVMNEIAENKFMRQDLKEAIFDDYTRNVQGKDGSFSVNAFEDWKDEVGGMLEKVFTPEEMLRARKRGGLREVVESGRETMSNLENSLSRVIGVEGGINLRNPAAGSTIYKQLKNMDSGRLRRTVGLLEQGDMLPQVQQLFKEDLRQILKPKVAGRTASRQSVENLSNWIKNNENLIRAMHPGQPNLAQQYVADLRIVSRMQGRKALRTAVVGTREEANPTALAFTRVTFGPLSRAQRFLTAAQRFRTRRMGEAAVDMVQDPEKLRMFMRIKDQSMGSRQAAQVMGRVFGNDFFDSVGVDWEDPEQREGFIQSVAELRSLGDQIGEDE